ncbi:hypothetical protein M405DRAFT_629418 [Rhizopogon salebrosus TDB-379]|nr:hypothetical protein M405DRAFT_629418 [Rhizopogon salebrosus TDB-379]
MSRLLKWVSPRVCYDSKNIGDGHIIDRSADGYFRCPTGYLQCKDSQQLWRHADRHHPTIPPHASPSITPAGPTTRDVSPANFGDESNSLPTFSSPKRSRERKRTSSAAKQSPSVPFSPNACPDPCTLAHITNRLSPLLRPPEKSPPDIFPELVQISIAVHCPTKLVICVECSNAVHHMYALTPSTVASSW